MRCGVLIALSGLAIEGSGRDHRSRRQGGAAPTVGRENFQVSADSSRLAPISAAFGTAAAITALFNTALAWAKDAYQPLTNLMNAITWVTTGRRRVWLTSFFLLG